MKLEKWALIAEIVGSAAIVVSLLMLMTEVRENTAEVRAASRQSIAERIEDRAMDAAVSPALLTALAQAQGGVALEEGSVELRHVRFFYTSVLTSVEEAFLQYQDGRLEQEYFEIRAARAIAPNFLDESGRAFLRRAREQRSYSEDLLDWIDENYGDGSEVR